MAYSTPIASDAALIAASATIVTSTATGLASNKDVAHNLFNGYKDGYVASLVL